MLRLNSSVKELRIIEGCRGGNPQCQQALFDKYAGKMAALCSRYIGDASEAEHVMVGAMVKVFQRIDQFTGQGSFEGWICRIMVNESLMYLRKNKMLSVMTDVQEITLEPNYEHLEATVNANALMDMVERLPVGYRTVFNLFAIEGFKHREISEMLGITIGTSKSQLNQARSLLKRKLAEIEEMTEKKYYYGE